MVDYSLEIETLRQAVATGALEVTYDGGRKVRYDNFESLKARIRYLEGLQNDSVSGSSGSSCAFASFDRGDR